MALIPVLAARGLSIADLIGGAPGAARRFQGLRGRKCACHRPLQPTILFEPGHTIRAIPG
jgi:hypothetical protein